MNFFDKYPVLHPWKKYLRGQADVWYKPREVFWRNYLKHLNFQAQDKVLEVGCGPGVLLDRLGLKYKFSGVGLDASSKAIDIAKSDKAWFKNEYLIGSAEKLPFGKESFDKVITFDVLEHLKNQTQAIKEMVRVLKPNGKILIYTINSRQLGTWNWLISKFGVDIYKQFDHCEELLVDPKKLRIQLEKEGIEVQTLTYFNAFFSLIADELIMLFLKKWGQVIGWETHPKFAMMILRVLTLFSLILTPVFKVLDMPWTVFGYSNSFLIIGKKKNE